jgi:serine/threonine-protein kinase
MELPYGKGWIDGDTPSPVLPSRRQPALGTKDYDAVLLKALELDPADRYSSVAEMAEDWQRVRQGLLPRAQRAGPIRRAVRAARRHPWRVAVCLLLILLLGGLGAALMPRDSTIYRTVYVDTEPQGARVVLVPVDPDTGALMPEKKIRTDERTPAKLKRVPAGEYLIVAELADHRFHEVFRTIPTFDEETGGSTYKAFQRRPDGGVQLDEISIPGPEVVKGMTRFEGGSFMMDSTSVNQVPPFKVIVAPFYLDTTEVSFGAWKQHLDAPIIRMPKETPDGKAAAFVTFDQALYYAAQIGKRLPDEFEYEFAATAGGKYRFPWGDEDKIKAWTFGKVGEPSWDQTKTNPPVCGLFSNVAEWTLSSNWPYESADPRVHAFYAANTDRFRKTRIVRGGPFPVVDSQQGSVIPDASPIWDPRFRHAISRHDRYRGLGFRCARSAKPRFLDD